MKKRFLFLSLIALGAAPRWAGAQAVLFQNLQTRPVYLCAGQPVTITFQAALPGNNTASQSLYLYGTFSTTSTVSASSQVFLWSGTGYNSGNETFNGPETVLSPSYNATWASVNPAFTNYVTYTAITTVPTGAGFTNGSVVYLTIGGDNGYTSGYTMPYSIQAAVTVDCTQSAAINTGDAAVVSGGVTYSGSSNAVTVLVSNNGCITNTPTPTATSTPTATPTLTPTFVNSPTPTGTSTVTATSTPSGTPTLTPTATNSFTATWSPTFTRTPTVTNTPTITNTPTATPTPTATIPDIDIFSISKNVFNASTDGPVSIRVEYTKFPGNYDLKIYNSAGEHIKTLRSTYLTSTVDESYTWDGKNKYGDKCASGIYIFYLEEPFSVKLKRIVLIR